MDLDKVINGAVLEIARRKRPQLGEVRDEQALIQDLGLASLDIAELVATLEFELQADPFSSKVAIASVRTLHDLKNAYRQVL